MNKAYDADTRKVIKDGSAGNLILSFLMTLAYAATSAVAAMAGREMIEKVSLKIITANIDELTNLSQFTGFRRISQISAIVLMIGLWLCTFMVVWHKLERCETMRSRVKLAALWIGGSVVAFFVFALTLYFTGCGWPQLTGAV